MRVNKRRLRIGKRREPNSVTFLNIKLQFFLKFLTFVSFALADALYFCMTQFHVYVNRLQTKWHRHRWNLLRKSRRRSDEVHPSHRNMPQPLKLPKARNRQSWRELSMHSHGWGSSDSRPCSFDKVKLEPTLSNTFQYDENEEFFSVFFRAILTFPITKLTRNYKIS